MSTPSIDLNEIARRYREATTSGSQEHIGAVINREGRLVPEGQGAPEETSKIPTTPFAQSGAASATGTRARLARDRAVVQSKFPLDTREVLIEQSGTTAWFYTIKNELGVEFEFATFFDGVQYQSSLIKPEGLEQEIVKQHGGHYPHMFSDGYICLAENGGGVTSLEEAYAKTAMWAYHMAAFLQTQGWLFLNRPRTAGRG